MAADLEELDVELLDGVSGPAASAAQGLGTLVDAFDVVSDAAKSIVGDLGNAAEGFGKLLSEDPSGLLDIGQALENIAATLVDVTEKALAAGAALAIQDTTFRDDTVTVLNKLAGDGEQLYQKATQIAAATGKTKEVVVDQIKRLLGAGIAEGQLDEIEKALADFDAVRGKAGSTRLEKTIEKINAKGQLDKRAFEQLSQLGIQTADVYQALAKATGKTVDQVKAAVKAGQIDAKTGIDAILATVEKKTGGTAEKLANSIPGLLNKLSIAVSGVFDHVDLGPIKKVLSSVVDAFNGPAGKHLGDSISHLFNAIFGAFGKLGSKGGAAGVIDTIADGIDAFAKFAKKAIPVVISAIEAAVAALRVVGSVVEWVADHWKALTAIVLIAGAPLWIPIATAVAVVGAALYVLVEAIDMVVDVISGLVDAASGIPSALEAAVEWLSSAFDSAADGIESGIDGAIDAVEGLVDEFVDVGSQIVQGIVDGIESGAASVVDAIVNVAKSALNAAKSALGINSPSKVFADVVGTSIPEGTAAGVDRGAPQAAAAVKRMSQGTVEAAAAAAHKVANDNGLPSGVSRPGAIAPTNVAPSHASTTNNTRGGDQNVTIHFSPQIPIQGAASPEDAAKQAKAATAASHAEFERQFAQFLRRVA